MPAFRSLEQKYPSRSDVTFVYLTPDNADTGSAFLKKAGLTGTAHFSQDLRAIGVTGTPAVLVSDKQGKVRYSVAGALTPETTRDLVAAVSR